jgi:hypothetical protein
MPYEQEVFVTEIKADFDPFGGEYTQISLAYRLPIPMPPRSAQAQPLPPRPNPVMYKHALHIMIPRDSWTGQYTMWDSLILRVEDTGEVRLSRPRR